MCRFLKIASIFLSLLISFAARAVDQASDQPADLATQPPVQKAETQPTTWFAHILREKPTGQHIQFLGTPEVKIPVLMVYQDNKFRPLIELPIQYVRPGWTLFVQGNIQLAEDGGPGQFRLYAYLNSRVNLVDITAQGPVGAHEIERIYIVAPEAQEFKVQSPWDAVTLGIGSTFLTYKQTTYVDYHAWTGLLTLQAHSPEDQHRFGVLAEADMTILSVSSNEGYGPQVGQAFLDGVYFWPAAVNSKWRSEILLGANYITIITNGAPFGFSNLYSMEAGFRARSIIGPKSNYIYELKFAPLGGGVFDFSNRGITASIFRSWMLSNLHRGEIGLKYVDFTYHSSADVVVDVNVMSLMLGYTL